MLTGDYIITQDGISKLDNSTLECRKCGDVKNLEMFCRNKLSKNGRSNICKKCHNKYHENKIKRQPADISFLICNKCNIEQPIANFYKNPSNKNGYSGCCRKCKSEWAKLPEVRKRKLAIGRKSYHKHKTPLIKKYGLTKEQYAELLEKHSVCAICGNKPNKRCLHVDHDHFTGKVRGLLCTNCNTSIGLMKENVVVMQKAIDYLNKNK